MAAEIAGTLEHKFTFERPRVRRSTPCASGGRTCRQFSPHARRTSFVGRQAELALLTTLLEQVMQSGRARAVAVRGEPGIGKSSLIQALIRKAGDSGVTAHTVQVLDFGQSAADRPLPR